MISLTPLIDVVFILLVFFMLASSFLTWRAIGLDAPKATGASASMEQGILIEVRRDGPRLAGESLPLASLGGRTADLLARRPGRPVLVRPDDGVPVQDMVAVLDALAGRGIGNLSLIRRGQ